MKLSRLRICNFQSFGPDPEVICFDDINYLIGPNGSGKTAVLQALCRLFAFDQRLRRVQHSDFHVPVDQSSENSSDDKSLWIEAEFEFPETEDDGEDYSTVPPNFSHMRLDSHDGFPLVRFRIEATLDSMGEIEEALKYVLQADEDGKPLKLAQVPKQDRNNIQVHYLPAQRDPADHISYATNSLLGRTFRAANWTEDQECIAALAGQINDHLSGNLAVKSFSDQLSKSWQNLHTGTFFTDPKISFERNEIEALLRHLTVGFAPGHTEKIVDFTRLSDGQKSLLYLSLVLTNQVIGRKVLAGEIESFDIEKLRPATFTFIAMEEPENSLSPHFLGRIISELSIFAKSYDSQTVVATHAPSLLRRVPPESIRYLRLNDERQTQVKTVVMPPNTDEAYKFVREAVQAFPELYFSRLVILGEGDSEEIVLPRLLQACGPNADEAAVSIAPLGGRHVNHFWRLLRGLNIPFLTLLDLDLGRYQGGWGRIRYVVGQMLKFPLQGSTLTQAHQKTLPKWNGADNILETENGGKWLAYLESCGVFFSSPLDLDFAMLKSFSDAYALEAEELEDPDKGTIVSVLGKKYSGTDQYDENDQKLFQAYHERFKIGSKPAAHLEAISELDDKQLSDGMPKSIRRLIDSAIAKLEEIPE